MDVALSKQFDIGHSGALSYLDSITRRRLSREERTSTIHGDWNGNMIVGAHPLTHRSTIMLNDLEYSGYGSVHTDHWMGVAAVLWNGLPIDGYRAFIEGYGPDAPSPLELKLFGVIWTFNRLMAMSERIAGGHKVRDRLASWDELVSIALTDPFGDPAWREMCDELSIDGPEARFSLPERWPRTPFLGNSKKLSHLTGH